VCTGSRCHIGVLNLDTLTFTLVVQEHAPHRDAPAYLFVVHLHKEFRSGERPGREDAGSPCGNACIMVPARDVSVVVAVHDVYLLLDGQLVDGEIVEDEALIEGAELARLVQTLRQHGVGEDVLRQLRLSQTRIPEYDQGPV